MKRQPETSVEAYRSMTSDIIRDHHKKIILALSELKTGTYEEIANHIGFKNPNAVSRRLSELIKDNKVERLPEKRKTSSGRSAFVHRLVTVQLELF